MSGSQVFMSKTMFRVASKLAFKDITYFLSTTKNVGTMGQAFQYPASLQTVSKAFKSMHDGQFLHMSVSAHFDSSVEVPRTVFLSF